MAALRDLLASENAELALPPRSDRRNPFADDHVAG